MLQIKELDVKVMRNDFPIFKTANGKQFVYLDSAATSLTPASVVNAEREYYEQYNANIHRGVYKISEIATQKYEEAHEKVANFIGCAEEEVIFVKNATEALNLVMYSYGMHHVQEGDNIVISIMEHHSNFVPWQQLCKIKKVDLRIVGVDSEGNVDMKQLGSFIDEKTKIVAVTHMSNVFGSVVDVKEVTKLAHAKNAIVVIDAAQSAAHINVNFNEIGCDFLAFSGHKLLGPTGIGVLVGKKELLGTMQPFLFGGDMIKSVSIEKTEWNVLPYKFEAGTPNIAGGIALGKAIDYLNGIGMNTITAHEKELGSYALEKLKEINGIKIIGGLKPRGTISFVVDGVHAHDVATILDSVGVAVRAGHHCCMPLMKKLGVTATVRISLHIYNNKEDVDALIDGLKKVKQVFRL